MSIFSGMFALADRGGHYEESGPLSRFAALAAAHCVFLPH